MIVSGGDPLIASDSRITAILKALAGIESIDHVRLATRAPVTLPQRITDELAAKLRDAHPALWIMTHFNHPRELTPESTRACATLVDHGLPIMNQSVLLRGVNDSVDTLKALFRGLVKRRVRPYYLLQCDPVKGTGHLRTPLSRGLELMEQIQGHMSGIAVPKFIVDTPEGRGKVNLAPPALGIGDGVTTLRTFRGELVDYRDPPAPKRRNPAISSRRGYRLQDTRHLIQPRFVRLACLRRQDVLRPSATRKLERDELAKTFYRFDDRTEGTHGASGRLSAVRDRSGAGQPSDLHPRWR